MKNGLWIADVKLALYVFWECLPLRQKTTPELWWFFCDENFLGGRGALHVDGLLEIGVVTNYMS